MKIEGKLVKSGRWWAVDVPLLLIHTQGRSRREALKMAKDAVEGLVDQQSFSAHIVTSTDDRFMIGCDNEKALLAIILKQQRASRNMSIRDVAKRLGSNSPTAYARYESGHVTLTFEKFTELLHAIDGEAEAVMTLFRKHA